MFKGLWRPREAKRPRGLDWVESPVQGVVFVMVLFEGLIP